MYELKTSKVKGDDKDGLYEPSVWFNATWDAWTISLAMYQEGPVDYSSMTHSGTYFDRPGIRVCAIVLLEPMILPSA